MLWQRTRPYRQDALVIVVGALAMAATFPGRTHGLGMVTEPLLRDLGLSHDDGRVFYASLNLWATLLGALFCLPVGWAFDRWDRRLVLAANLVLLGAAVMWMSTVQSWQGLTAALVLTRGLGQSALSVVSITIVAKSFSAKRLGMAMAWYAVVAAPFHLLLIKGIGWALSEQGENWRSVWNTVGWTLMALAGCAAFLKSQARQSPATAKSSDHGMTLLQALKTPAFWTFSLTISLWGMIYAGVALFNEDIFRERGFDRSLYFNVLAVVTVVALVSKLAFGWLVNRVRLTRLLAACLGLTGVSLASLPFASQPWHAYAYGAGLGVASGAVALMFFAIWGRLYGDRHLGRIQGVAQMLTVIASAAGPLIFSYSKRATTTYTSVFQLLAAIVFLMAVIALFTPLPSSVSSRRIANGDST